MSYPYTFTTKSLTITISEGNLVTVKNDRTNIEWEFTQKEFNDFVNEMQIGLLKEHRDFADDIIKYNKMFPEE